MVYHQVYIICMHIMYVGGRVPGLVCTLRCAMQWLVLLSGTALELADLAASYVFGILLYVRAIALFFWVSAT